MARRPLRPAVGIDPQYDAIRAGLMHEDCPAGGNRFLHNGAKYCRGRSRHWPRYVAVFRSLDAFERREIIHLRRTARRAVQIAEMIRDHRAHLAAGLPVSPYPPNDPRRVLDTWPDDGASD